jgi:hypothetical protein
MLHGAILVWTASTTARTAQPEAASGAIPTVNSRELAGESWRTIPLSMTAVYAVVARAVAVAEGRERGPAAI